MSRKNAEPWPVVAKQDLHRSRDMRSAMHKGPTSGQGKGYGDESVTLEIAEEAEGWRIDVVVDVWMRGQQVRLIATDGTKAKLLL